MITQDLGIATAYGYAKSKGYTGTEAEFAELMASYASTAQTAIEAADRAVEANTAAQSAKTDAQASKTAAQTAAQTATTKASEASQSASTATTKASEASTSADTASAAATSASTSAQTATTAAATATTKASEASESATTATTAKTDAEAARDAAAQSASEAAASAESIDPDEFNRKIYAAFATDTASGSIAHFEDGADSIPMKDVLVHIEPVQAGSGDPSPDNVRPITGWTGAKVTVSPTTDAKDGTTYSIAFPAEAGTVYGGYVDVTGGELVVDRAEVADLGTLSWSYGPTSNPPRFFAYLPYSGKNDPWWVKDAMISTGEYTLGANIGQDGADKKYGISAKTIYFTNAEYTNANDFKASITGTQVVYELAEPIHYPLTPTEITSLLGTNSIWADTGDVSVEYRADTTLYISRLAEPDADMIADSNITSGQYFMVGNSLYRATSNIASGASVIVGTNAVKVSLATALNEINQ